MKNKWVYRILIIVILFSFVFPGGHQAAKAQAPQPPEPPEEIPNREACVEGEPCQDQDGNWYLPAGSIPDQTSPNELLAIGDSDDYGYTLTSTTYSWIDATDGTNTGLTRSRDQAVVSLPWDFPFYENSYTEVYIVGPGYLTFSNQNIVSQSQMPNPAKPNNIIAPYWSPVAYIGEGGTGQAFYEFGGTAPNRYLLVEYYQMSDFWGGASTYEVQLFESGDIKFQYNNMDDAGFCAEAGIEDSVGMDGVTLSLWCGGVPDSGSAVLFTRPDPSARVKATPLYQGDFSYSGEVDEFIFTVSNTGDLGADTYDMEVTLAPGGTLWTAALFDAETGGPLTDTDGDTKIDTGAIPQGASFDVLVKVTAPAGLTAGAGIKTLIDVTSSLNVSKNKTVTLESTVPAAFAQTYRDNSESNLDTDLNWPSTQLNVESAQDHWNIYEPAIVETPEQTFVHVWSEWVWEEDNNRSGYVLNYAVVDRLGQVIQPATALTSLYGSSDFYTEDRNYSLAVTPDGKIGVLWSRYLDNYATDLWNQNVWFAVLNPSGGLAYGPVNLTNNNQWGYDPQGGYISYYETKVEASADNRFMLAWQIDYYHQPTGTEDSDIYYMIRNSSGSAVTGLINMTEDVEDADWYSDLSLTALTGNKFYVDYHRVICGDQRCYGYSKYRVINSSGSLVVGEGNASYYQINDSIQLPNGNIFLGTFAWDNQTGNYLAGYAILNGSTYQVITSGSLSHPSAAEIYYGSVSVTKTPDGKAIMTWIDSNYMYQYYALFHSNGTLLNGPVISHYFEDNASVNSYGQAITTNTWQPNSGLDILTEFSGDIYGAAPGGAANIQVHYANQGLTTAVNPSLTLTLADGLTYSYDTSGITPTVDGNTVTWDLPDLAFADGETFGVYVSIPSDAVIGTFYDIELAITSDGTDVDQNNNADDAQIMASYQVFLPVVMRQIQ